MAGGADFNGGVTQDGKALLDDPVNTALGVRLHSHAADGLTYAQLLGRRFHDHRGQSTLASVGVLVETAIAGTVYAALPGGRRSVAASLTVNAAQPLPDADEVVAQGRSRHVDLQAGTGLASGVVRDSAGAVCATVSARGVVVERPVDHSGATAPVQDLDVEAGPGVQTGPSGDELAERLGLDVVQAIAFGDIPRGPLADLLGLEVRLVRTGSVTGVFTPQEWMANSMGTLQGGVLLAVADQVCGLAAETATDPGERYRVLDLRTDFVRSPEVSGPDIRFEADVVRAGRRIELVEARISTDRGRLLTTAWASVQRY